MTPKSDWRLGWLSLTLVVSMPSPAFAEQKTALVVHRGPGADECPDEEALAKQVNSIVGREVIGAGPGQDAAWIEVTMSRQEDGYGGVVRTFGRTVGKRELHDTGQDCSGLGDAVAVSLALLWTSQQNPFDDATPEQDEPEVDAGADLGATDLDASPALKEPAAAARPPSKKPSKPARRVRRESSEPASTIQPGADAFAGAAQAVLEHPVPGAELAFRFEVGPHVSLGLSAGGVGPDRVELDAGDVDLRLFYAGLRACAAIRSEEPRLLFCAKPVGGVLEGEGNGFDNSRKRQLLYLAIALGLELRKKIAGGWGWAGELALLTPFERQGFSVSDPSGRRAVFTTPSLGLLALLGVSWDARP